MQVLREPPMLGETLPVSVPRASAERAQWVRAGRGHQPLDEEPEVQRMEMARSRSNSWSGAGLGQQHKSSDLESILTQTLQQPPDTSSVPVFNFYVNNYLYK